MKDLITVFFPGTVYYEKLRRAAELLTKKGDGASYSVENTWFDFGRDLDWTTIVCRRADGTRYQALYPADREEFLFSRDLEKSVNEFFARHRKL